MKKNKTWLFILLLSITAVSIAGTAAYFSVFGLSKLFAGAGVSALILFGSLEFGKLIGVTVLQRFWNKFSYLIRFIFTTMVIVIMLITSMGIYGYLRNAYDQTSNTYNIIQKETKILTQRKNIIQIEIDRYQKVIDSKNKQINSYIDNRSIQESLVSNLYTQSSDTSLTSGQSWAYRDRATKTQDGIKKTDDVINVLRNENSGLYTTINLLNDSISKMDIKILELETSDISVEIGPLKYLSELTGKSMDTVVGVLIFLIIFVFDPFAIILIIAANQLSISNDNIIEKKEKPLEINNKIDEKPIKIDKELEEFQQEMKNELKDLNILIEKEEKKVGGRSSHRIMSKK